MTTSPPSGSAGDKLGDPLRPNRVWRTCRFLLRHVFVFWLDYRARGLDRLPPGGALVLANHESFLDPLLAPLALHRPVSYLARHNLFSVPFIGFMLRNTYVIPINRDSAGAGSFREAVRRIRHGFLVGLFPEGTRSADGQLGEIKPGFIALLRHAQSPVVPVGIAGARQVLPRGAKWMRRGRVRVAYGPPIPWAELEPLTHRGREADLLELIRQRMLAARDEAGEWRASAD